MIRYVLSTYSVACHVYVAHAHIETEPLLNARRIKRRHFNFHKAFVFEFFFSSSLWHCSCTAMALNWIICLWMGTFIELELIICITRYLLVAIHCVLVSQHRKWNEKHDSDARTHKIYVRNAKRFHWFDKCILLWPHALLKWIYFQFCIK